MNAETLTRRVVRLLAANSHALVESLEARNPEALLQQYVRELDEAISEVQVELGREEAARHLATSSIARQNNEIEKLGEQIELALRSGKDEAASAGVAKQLDLEDQIAALSRSLDDASAGASGHEKTLLGLRAKRREMEAALQAFIASRKPVAPMGQPSSAYRSSSVNKAERAESGFNRTLADASHVTGMVGATSADAARLEELSALQRKHRVAERLAMFKASVGKDAKEG